MFGSRVAIVSLLLFCLQALVQARVLDQSPYPGYGSLFKRQSNIEQPRCPPKGSVSKLGSVTDDYNKPESSDKEILNENLAAYASFIKGQGVFAGLGESDTVAKRNVTERSPRDETWFEKFGKSLQRRILGAGYARHENALVKVPTNGADVVLYFGDAGGPITNRVISTQDLCGCTVFVVSSPFATIMLHVLERRATEFTYEGPASTIGGAQQAIMDGNFVAKGRELLMESLRKFGTTTADVKTFFPPATTTVTVVAPAANPDYQDWEFWRRREDNPPVGRRIRVTEQMWRDMGFEVDATFQEFDIGADQNPVSTHPIIAGASNPDRLIYPTAAKTLLESVSSIMGVSAAQSKILTYRRRYGNDPAHRTDDRHYVAVEPFVTLQGTVATVLYYDEDKASVLTRL